MKIVTNMRRNYSSIQKICNIATKKRWSNGADLEPEMLNTESIFITDIKNGVFHELSF